MGICASNGKREGGDSAEDKKDKEIQIAMKQEEAQERGSVKLLMLGAGDSGKTTLRKQMRNIYGEGFDEEARKEFLPVITENVLDGARDVLKHVAATEGLNLESDESKAAAKLLMSRDGHTRCLTPEMSNALKQLWENDEAFKSAFEKRAKFHLQDCWVTFVKSLIENPEWGGETYIPTEEECVRARIRTSGITEEVFTLKKVVFKIFDAGGQRAERRKWIHCFDNVTAVIFVAALSGYDQNLFEDNEKNRLEEAFELFSEVCNSSWFTKTPLLLFLNKRDLLQEKLVEQKIPLNVSGRFADAPDTYDVEEAIEWITAEFLKRNEKPDKEIYVHVTTAVDSDNVKAVFDTCTNIILRKNLEATGFMVN